ncbi:MAG: hypothetical protein A2Y38_25005 [Spirochaetes bacterium GWB1_59_5]|nr:MAG: hypothetical protein A2Y38_25005 [Spirochaetes bacterium GWB1_59_5]
MIESLKTLLRRLLNTSGGGIRYKVGGVVYVQRPLVLLQIEQLSSFLGAMTIPAGLNVVGIVRLLGDRIADALAILLTPAGTEVYQKDMAATAEHLRNYVDIETAVRVVEDFLTCNPVGSVFDKLAGVMAKWLQMAETATGSTSSSASSPAGT